MRYFQHPDLFESRHIGPDTDEINKMVKLCGVNSIDQIIDETIPAVIRLKNKLKLDEPLSEFEFVNHISKIASKNKIYKSYICTGYYNCITPGVILRNILENRGNDKEVATTLCLHLCVLKETWHPLCHHFRVCLEIY